MYKKDLHDPDNHNGVITHLEPDILECDVKWALGSIKMHKASGGDGIPVELFQILKDDAVKMLHSIWQQIWKTRQWPRDWKRSVFIPILKKGNAKECPNFISHTSKVMLKILQARLQKYVNRELPDVQAGFRKGSGTRDQIANICWNIEKARVPVLCPMSESPSRKREGLQDNATGKKGKFITDSSQGPLLHPMQWCKSESPEPKLLHKFIG